MSKVPHPRKGNRELVLRCDMCRRLDPACTEDSLLGPNHHLCIDCHKVDRNFLLLADPSRKGRWEIKGAFATEAACVAMAMAFPCLCKIEPVPVCSSCFRKHTSYTKCPLKKGDSL